jgi:predicted enzyme related to lactoylglutathione lyase
VVRQAGGKARPAFDVGPAGRMSVCHDPNGAEFDVWEPRGLHGTDVDSDEIGAPTWFETVTTDAQRTSKFYSAVFGWTAEAAGPGYHVLKHMRGPLAGINELTGDSPAGWATYFAVRDAERTLQEAKKLRGTVVAPVTFTNGAHMGGIRSPQGVSFFVMQRGK